MLLLLWTKRNDLNLNNINKNQNRDTSLLDSFFGHTNTTNTDSISSSTTRTTASILFQSTIRTSYIISNTITIITIQQ